MSSLVVSLDFEMRWGVLERIQDQPDQYKENLLSVRDNVPWILKIFEERGISATWATVGALGCDNWADFNKFKPEIMPSYDSSRMQYDNDFNIQLDPSGEVHFAYDLIKSILKTPGQELGMHTFGHIYGTESNVTYEEFICDLKANINIFLEKFGVHPTSLVYPRNQVVHQDILLNENFIRTFRGNEDASWYSAKSQREKRILNRGLALLDSINPFVSYSNSFDSSSLDNIKSSAMLRIHMNSFIRKWHLSKLKSNISRLKSNEYYHIWFHPHNIGRSEARKADFVKFFDFVGNMISKGELNSENMNTLNIALKKHQKS